MLSPEDLNLKEYHIYLKDWSEDRECFAFLSKRIFTVSFCLKHVVATSLNSIVTEAVLRGSFQRTIVHRIYGPECILNDWFVKNCNEVTQWEKQYSSGWWLLCISQVALALPYCLAWAIPSQSLCICADESCMCSCGELTEHFNLAAFLITHANLCSWTKWFQEINSLNPLSLAEHLLKGRCRLARKL